MDLPAQAYPWIHLFSVCPGIICPYLSFSLPVPAYTYKPYIPCMFLHASVFILPGTKCPTCLRMFLPGSAYSCQALYTLLVQACPCSSLLFSTYPCQALYNLPVQACPWLSLLFSSCPYQVLQYMLCLPSMSLPVSAFLCLTPPCMSVAMCIGNVVKTCSTRSLCEHDMCSLFPLSLQSWKAGTTFHYCWEVKCSFKLVWMESSSPCNSLIGHSLKWRCCSLVGPMSFFDKNQFWPSRKRSIVF